VPVTSSHNWCAARPNDRAVARAPAHDRAEGAAASGLLSGRPRHYPELSLKQETLFTASILTASGDYNGAAQTGDEPFPRPRHLKE